MGSAPRDRRGWADLAPYLRPCGPALGYFDLTQGTGNVEGLVLASSLATLVWSLVTFLPMLALSWRRLHDAGFPVPLYFVALVPVIGPLAALILMLLPTRLDRRSPKWEYPLEAHHPNPDAGRPLP
ncbi:DUF805 domain-containing protein [Nesterenkonia sp. E16_7]|nr:DUF805 domain-containing protein [Nesterenkonia sp. E16_10]MBO0598605.1 DUF805 domain-containing protein [Nesterenkonia sp. E16_7]